jgi:hypothetical protein
MKIGHIRVSEPEFQYEQELTNAIASAIRGAVDGTRAVVLPSFGFGLDVVVFTDGAARTCFFEMKVKKMTSGRVGINANQVRLLFDAAIQAHRPSSQISLLDESVRWVLGDCSQAINSRRFLFFSCSEAQRATAAGEITSTKQNNLNLGWFASNRWIGWTELLEQIEVFVRR